MRHATLSPHPHQARMSDWDLSDAIIGTLTLNAKFNADIVTEYAFNAIGILEEVRMCGRGATEKVHRCCYEL